MPKKAPAKRTRDLEKSRQEILSAAFLEVFQQGFQGVAIDDIVKRTTMTKGAFYHQFPTKLDLGYALVEEVITPMILDRWVEPLNAYENALDGILDRLRILIGEADARDLRWGCPLNNLVQEMSPLDAGFRKRLEKALELWIDQVDRHLRRSQKDGWIDAQVDTRKVAHFVVMAHEGFYGLLKGLNDPDAFRALYEPLKAYFATLETKKARAARTAAKSPRRPTP